MANVGYGMTGHVLIDFQTAYGTSKVTSLQSFPIVSENLTLNKEQSVEGAMFGRLGESRYFTSRQIVEGEISIEANEVAIGNFLKSVVGLTSTTSTIGIQTHIFNMRSTDFSERSAGNPATFEVYRDVGSAALYYDVLGNNLSLNVANGELLTATAGFIGAGFSRKANATPSFPIVSGRQPGFRWDQCSVSINGAAVVDVTDLTVDINNNLEPVYTLTGSLAPYRIKRTSQQTIEISGNFVFASHSYWQAYEDGTELPMKVHFAGQAPHTLTLDFPRIRFKSFEPVMDGAGLINAGFTASALFDVGSNNAGTITLVNTQDYY